QIAPGDTEVMRERNNLLDAIRLFADMAPDANPAEVWHHRAGFLRVNQRLDEALAALGQSLASEPDYLPALITKGQVLTELGRTEEGMASYRQHGEGTDGEKSWPSPDDPP